MHALQASNRCRLPLPTLYTIIRNNEHTSIKSVIDENEKETADNLDRLKWHFGRSGEMENERMQSAQCALHTPIQMMNWMSGNGYSYYIHLSFIFLLRSWLTDTKKYSSQINKHSFNEKAVNFYRENELIKTKRLALFFLDVSLFFVWHETFLFDAIIHHFGCCVQLL